MFKRISVGAIWAFVILLTCAGASIGVAKKHKSNKNKTPAGRAVLWREPVDIQRRNLYLGRGPN